MQKLFSIIASFAILLGAYCSSYSIAPATALPGPMSSHEISHEHASHKNNAAHSQYQHKNNHHPDCASECEIWLILTQKTDHALLFTLENNRKTYDYQNLSKPHATNDYGLSIAKQRIYIKALRLKRPPLIQTQRLRL